MAQKECVDSSFSQVDNFSFDSLYLFLSTRMILLYKFSILSREVVEKTKTLTGYCTSLFFVLQNSFISYETLHKLGIPQPIQFLQVS